MYIITIILLLLPIIVSGQIEKDPLPKKKVEQSINKPKTNYFQPKTNYQLKTYYPLNDTQTKMNPRDRIGYIMSPNACPFGINYYHFMSQKFGLYVDYRTDFNVLAPGEAGLRDKDWIINDMDGFPTGNLTEGGYNVFNVGVALSIFKNKGSLAILYAGFGSSVLKYFEEYSETYTGPYYAKHSSEKNRNINFGILLQTKSPISFQVGFDSAVKGSINFGIGLNFASPNYSI